ncbi:hypothetical protein MNBD_GAMMA05-728 [hydrothermal vent metagenome]|uniref:TraB/GumN family protein n=1 Tax=hydrothermal vent metagenome TaxID=652676 RepID=A0A3B0WJ95_9ZZZZ
MRKAQSSFILCVVLVLGFTSAYADNDKAFFWQVKSKQATVYLMGAIHFADSSFYPLRPDIESAFQRSDTLVVELNINKIDANAYSQLIARKGVYKTGRTIKDDLTEETWLQLRQRLLHLNVRYETIKSYKPGVLVLTLSSIQVMQMGFSPQLGIDVYFLTKASQKSNPKKIVELETMEQQLDLFLNIPNGDLLLKESLYSLDEAELLMADMVRYWKQGDDKLMSKLLFEDALTQYPAFSAIYNRLFFERNIKMTEKIDAMLKQKGQYFVVVGAGHLIGKKGIVELLSAKGYEVKRN